MALTHTFTLEFNEEQQQWHHNHGQHPEGSNGFVVILRDCNSFHSVAHSHILTIWTPEPNAGITIGEAKIIGALTQLAARQLWTETFLLRHKLLGVYNAELKNTRYGSGACATM